MLQSIDQLKALTRQLWDLIAATLYIMKDISIIQVKTVSFINVATILGTFLLLNYTKIHPPLLLCFV